MSLHSPDRRHSAGFTLIEAVIALVIGGLAAVGITQSVAYGTKIYTALERLSEAAPQMQASLWSIRQIIAAKGLDHGLTLSESGELLYSGSPVLNGVDFFSVSEENAFSVSEENAFDGADNDPKVCLVTLVIRPGNAQNVERQTVSFAVYPKGGL